MQGTLMYHVERCSDEAHAMAESVLRIRHIPTCRYWTALVSLFPHVHLESVAWEDLVQNQE